MNRPNRYYGDDCDDEEYAKRNTVVPWTGDDDDDDDAVYGHPKPPPRWNERPDVGTSKPERPERRHARSPDRFNDVTEGNREADDDPQEDEGGQAEELAAGFVEQLSLSPRGTNVRLTKPKAGQGQGKIIVIEELHLDMRDNYFENFSFNKKGRGKEGRR